jgi:acyl-CoA hydrolase
MLRLLDMLAALTAVQFVEDAVVTVHVAYFRGRQA